MPSEHLHGQTSRKRVPLPILPQWPCQKKKKKKLTRKQLGFRVQLRMNLNPDGQFPLLPGLLFLLFGFPLAGLGGFGVLLELFPERYAIFCVGRLGSCVCIPGWTGGCEESNGAGVVVIRTRLLLLETVDGGQWTGTLRTERAGCSWALTEAWTKHWRSPTVLYRLGIAGYAGQVVASCK